jgi:hypothetical protein
MTTPRESLMNNAHKETCNDQSKDVGPSGSKHTAPYLKITDKDEDMVSSAYERCSSL